MAKFQEKDEQAYGILLTYLDYNYIHYLDDCTSALQAWSILERHFGAQVERSKIALKMQQATMPQHPNIATKHMVVIYRRCLTKDEH